VSDWWIGTIFSQIDSLIYINFDRLERFRVQSDVNEQGLKQQKGCFTNVILIKQQKVVVYCVPYL
jgi:hypothetical protein